jgi:hypothetical protein
MNWVVVFSMACAGVAGVAGIVLHLLLTEDKTLEGY